MNPVTGWTLSCVVLLTILFLVVQQALKMQEDFAATERSYIAAQLDAQRKIEERNQRIQVLVALESSGVVQSVKVGTVMSDILNTASGTQKEFLARILPEAIKVGVAFGIPPSAIVGMSVYESRYGSSELATSYQNYFGIKALSSRWEGGVAQDMNTVDSGRRVKADFRAYTDIRASVLGFAEFLRESSRYEDAFNKTTGPEFVRVLNRSGYCPDRDYTDHVKGLMERHHLTTLDPLAQELMASCSKNPVPPVEGSHSDQLASVQKADTTLSQ